MVMGLVQVCLLVLGAVMLVDAQLPHSVQWLNPWSPGTYYSQNQVQALLPHGSSMTPRGYNRIEPNRVLNMPQPPVTFYPRGFPGSWNLVQTPVPAPIQKPVLVPVKESAPSPLPVPIQALADNSTQNNVPTENPLLPSGPNAVLPPAQDPGDTSVPVPFQSQDPGDTSVPVPFQNPPELSVSSTGMGPTPDPRYPPVPGPPQNFPVLSGLPQLSGPSTGLGPAHDPGQAPGTSPALTSSPSAVLLTPSQASPWNPSQAPPQEPGQSSAQAPHLALYQDLLKAVQVNLPTQPIKKLMWRFPKAPERPKQAPVHFDLRQPNPVNSVAAACGESSVHVEVKQDFFGNGKLINPNSLTLGGCAATGLDSAARVLIFNSELQGCGSVPMMTEDDLIYSFHLLYHPEPFAGTPIVRTGSINVQIACHYSRKHNVSSNPVAPTWVPYSSTVAAEENLVVTLKLMTDDWKYERPSNQYFLGEFLKIEASLTQFNHVPLRIFVDRCVATAVPDVNAVPRYSFIENHGCLVDAKITGSDSQFMKRVKDDTLQFQLEVFKFEQGNSSALYITCFLKVSTALQKTDAEHKACSFKANGWTAADGDDQDCNCCDAECFSRKARSVPTDEDQYFETEVPLGPILVEDDDDLLQ